MTGTTPLPYLRRFVLDRLIDVSGVSGVGLIAEGVEWSDGTASIRWTGEHPSVTFWDRGLSSVLPIHGHGGATKVVYIDPVYGPRPCPPIRPVRPPRRR